MFASLLWRSFECSLALLLWESDLNTWVAFWVGIGFGFHVVEPLIQLFCLGFECFVVGIMASSSNAHNPNKKNTLMRLLRDLELSRKKSFEQLRKEKEHSDLRIQEHIPRLEAKEQEREARKRGDSRPNPSQEKQTPKIPKLKVENDPNIYIEWEQKVDQIFNIHVVIDQKQVDLVILEFEDYAMTWWHQLCMDNINQESFATSWRDLKILMCARFVPSYYRRETLLKLQRL